MAELVFNASTNLEGGEKCRYEVRGYRELLFDHHVLNCFANHFLLWFLETLDSIGTSIVRMPLESPCQRLSEYLGQKGKRHEIFGKDEVDEVIDQESNDVE